MKYRIGIYVCQGNLGRK